MPIYEYTCTECSGVFDMFYPLKDWDAVPQCPDCGGPAKKNITSKILRDEPTWLDDEVRGVLQDTDDPATRPIETRTEYKRHLKDNGIVER